MMQKSKVKATKSENKKKSRTRKNKKDNYSFLNFSNQGGLMNTGIGRTNVAPATSGRTILTKMPKMNTMNETTVVKHSEYISDISQQENFTTTEYNINPGLSNTFVWLSTIAPNYERYRFRKLCFRYEVLTNTMSTGKVFFVPVFNVQDPAPVDKSEALSYEYAIGSQPWIQFGIQIPEKFLRSYNDYFVRFAEISEGADLKTYDPLNLFVCTEGSASPNLTVGEIWVDYEIELINPIGQPTEISFLNLNSSSLFYLQTGGFFGSKSQFPLGVSSSTAIQTGGLQVQITQGSIIDSTSGNTVTFEQDFVGSIVFQWQGPQFGTTGGFTWPPPLVGSTATNLDNSSLSFYNWCTYPATGSPPFVIAVMVLKAGVGQTICLNGWAGPTAISTSIQELDMIVSPMWTSLTPPVFPTLKKSIKKDPLVFSRTRASKRSELQRQNSNSFLSEKLETF